MSLCLSRLYYIILYIIGLDTLATGKYDLWFGFSHYCYCYCYYSLSLSLISQTSHTHTNIIEIFCNDGNEPCTFHSVSTFIINILRKQTTRQESENFWKDGVSNTRQPHHSRMRQDFTTNNTTTTALVTVLITTTTITMSIRLSSSARFARILWYGREHCIAIHDCYLHRHSERTKVQAATIA